jgi:hypothetical protein
MVNGRGGSEVGQSEIGDAVAAAGDSHERENNAVLALMGIVLPSTGRKLLA